MKLTKSELNSLAKSRLSTKRYKHTAAVADAADKLAQIYGLDRDKAHIAAMLHDITKEEPRGEQLQMLDKYGTIKPDELAGGEKTLHQATGYLYAKFVLGVEDEEILDAIRFHTTGRRNMGRLEQLIFTADTVSADRTYPEAAQLRKAAEESLEGCMVEICKFIISDRVKSEGILHPYTVDCYNWCLEQRNGR